VICAYPITPQTHIVEGLGEMVKTGELAGCEFINVESEFAALSVAIGASAAGARAYTATASQGLLFMAEAVYNASGLGLPIVMTVGQPRDRRADQHLERPLRQHVDARLRLDPALRRDQPGGARPAHPGVPAGRGAVAAGDGVHGRLHPDARLRARRHADAGEVDAFLPPYEPRQVLDPAEPVSIGAMVGPEAFMEVRYLAHAKQLQALELIPQLAAEFELRFGRASGGWCAPTARRGRRDHRRGAGLGATARSRTRSTRCATARGSRRARHHLVPAVPAGALRAALQGAGASSCWRRAWRWASAASCPTACARRCRASS
jgi:pyruvate ferredoxin oxidoreductase alpha subunit